MTALNWIMNRMDYKLVVLVCLICTLTSPALPQYELNVYPSTNKIQEVGTYVFEILIAGDGINNLTVPINT